MLWSLLSKNSCHENTNLILSFAWFTRSCRMKWFSMHSMNLSIRLPLWGWFAQSIWNSSCPWFCSLPYCAFVTSPLYFVINTMYSNVVIMWRHTDFILSYPGPGWLYLLIFEAWISFTAFILLLFLKCQIPKYSQFPARENKKNCRCWNYEIKAENAVKSQVEKYFHHFLFFIYFTALITLHIHH